MCVCVCVCERERERETEISKKKKKTEMDTATRVQILDEADYISHITNTFGKGMNSIILPLTVDKY